MKQPISSPKKIFDAVLDYIDENVMESKNSLIVGITELAHGYFEQFHEFFKSKTEMSITKYIRIRKLYFAFLEMKANPHKTNEVIAGLYLGVGGDTLSHNFDTYFGVTPTQARADHSLIKDNRINTDEIYADKENDNMQNTAHQTEPSLRMLEVLDYAEHEYGFKPEVFYAIAKVADHLDVPIYYMLDKCFDIMADVQSDPGYISPKVETAIDLELTAEDDLDAICEHFGCEHWEVDKTMVDIYRNQDKE